MDAKEFLDTWLKAVNDLDVAVLEGLYNEKAVLIPTFSNKIATTPAGIKDYFNKLGARTNLSVALHEKTLNIHSIKDQIYAISGMYLWKYDIDEELLSFEARFSYVVDLALDAPILNHHSSQIPRML